MTHTHLIIGRIPKANRELFSKHMVLANRAGVLMAGEIWIGEDGSLSVSNASGTFPSSRLLKRDVTDGRDVRRYYSQRTKKK